MSDFSSAEIAARKRLRTALDIEPWLEQRRSLKHRNSGVHLECYGDNPELNTVIFIPGFGTYSELYAQMLGKLSAEGFNIVSIDLPGHGYSEGRRGRYTVEQVCTIISEVIDDIQDVRTTSIAIFGFSIGSLIAVCAAERDLRINKVFCGTLLLPEIPPDLLHWYGWQVMWGSAWLFPTMEVPLGSLVDYRLLLAGHPAGHEINNDPLMVNSYPLETLSSLFTAKTKLISVQQNFDLAVLHGEYDEVIPFHYSQRIKECCLQPIELIKLDRAGHMCPWLKLELVVEKAAAWFHR